MVRVPHEILSKASALTAEEVAVLQRHTIWGLELLANVEFPWDIIPIVRSHHERCDGSDTPTVSAATRSRSPRKSSASSTPTTTSSRPFWRGKVESREAVWRIVEQRASWSARVLDAFVKTIV